MLIKFPLLFFVIALSACSPFNNTPSPAAKNVALPAGGNLHAQLTWTAPSTGAPDGYYIEASIDNANFTQIGTAATGATTATLTGLSPVLYYVRVRSYNAIASAPSQSIVVNLAGL